MADPAAAATDAAKAAGNKALGLAGGVLNQTLHPKYWLRNAGIVALSAVFLPAAVTAATASSGFSVVTLFSSAASNALGGVSSISAALPQAANLASSHIGHAVDAAQQVLQTVHP